MKKILFEDATLTSQAKVTIDGVGHLVTEAEYNGGTDLNADTFNELQDNVEDAINETAEGTTLYENSNGSNDTITLNESVADYSSILIEYKCNTYGYKTERILNPNNKNVVLEYLTVANDTIVQNASSRWYITSNKINLINSCMINSDTSGGIVVEQNNRLIYITKVIGYKTGV